MSESFKIRSQMATSKEAPGKVWFWELAAAVIDTGRCISCGACAAACPSDSIGIGPRGLPALVKMCTGCSLCWDACPRGGLRYEATWLRPKEGDELAETPSPLPTEGLRLPLPKRRPSERPGAKQSLNAERPLSNEAETDLGAIRALYQARWRKRTPGVQDGGVVSAILAAGLDRGELDGALVATQGKERPWKPEARIAKTREELEAAAGSYYSQTMALASLDLGRFGLEAGSRIAVVGTPCEIQGLASLQARRWSRGRSAVDSVVLKIALLCTKSFDYEALVLRELAERRGIAPQEIQKMDITKGRFLVWNKDGELVVDEPVRNFHNAALAGCQECADFLGRASDIAVGSVGSPEGWSSLLVRTEVGAKALAWASDELELEPLEDPGALGRLDGSNRKAALARLPRRLEPDGPLFIEFEEHMAAYGPTEMRPVIDWR